MKKFAGYLLSLITLACLLIIDYNVLFVLKFEYTMIDVVFFIILNITALIASYLYYSTTQPQHEEN